MEEWKEIPGWGRHLASTEGRVKRHSYGVKIPDRVLKGTVNAGGYRKVGHRLVHRLVAMAHIPNPESKPEVHHINHDRLDNRVENLMWVTRLEHCKYHPKA
jgi:hypothetical protein